MNPQCPPGVAELHLYSALWSPHPHSSSKHIPMWPTVVHMWSLEQLDPSAVVLQVAAAGGLDDFDAASAYIGGGPSETGIDGSIRYLLILHRSLSDAEIAALSSTLAGSSAVCGAMAIGVPLLAIPGCTQLATFLKVSPAHAARVLAGSSMLPTPRPPQLP